MTLKVAHIPSPTTKRAAVFGMPLATKEHTVRNIINIAVVRGVQKGLELMRQ